MDLIGREAELDALVERLSGRRLVTVTGPGGVGKTALARAALDRLAGGYELGAHIVDLTRVDEPGAVGAAIAGQLGFASFQAMLDSPTDAPALLLVDNCEHVIAAAAEAVDLLLEACRSPTVIATSRSPLDLPLESLLVVGPLPVPAAETDGLDSASARLFVERALDAGVELGPEHASEVAALCRQLDGMPLALELAAARTRTMTPAEILARLGQGVDVLSRPRYRGARRHRSIHDTIDWSYQLLPPDAAALLDRLALCAGPFDEPCALALGAAAELDRTAAADALGLLVASSLVVAEPQPTGVRFRLLETVRAFALERLRAQGLVEATRERLVDHVVADAVGFLAAGGYRWDRATVAGLLDRYHDIVAGLRWCLATDPADPTAAAAAEDRSMLLAAVLWGVVHQGHTDEIDELCRQVLARWPDSAHPHFVDAVATAATARCLVGDPSGATALAEATLDAAAAYPTAPVTLRRALAYAARAVDDRDRALAWYVEAGSLARERGLLALALEADVSRAQLLAERGDVDAALAIATAARAEAAAVGSPINEVWARTVEAHLHLRRDLAGGMAAVAEALDAARVAQHPAGISVNLRSLAWGRIRLGDLVGAAEALRELFEDLIARSGVADLRGALFTTAELLHAAGDPAWEPLAATARDLPAVGLMGGAIDSLVVLPSPEVATLSRRDAFAAARAGIQGVLDGAPPMPTSAAAATAAPPATDAAGAARIVDRGGLWELTFAGRTVHAKPSKGLVDLARLLAAPDRDIHCLELAGAAVEQGSTGEVLDTEARRAYEQRIRDLQEELDDADAANDLGRSERAQAELDAVVEHLAGALGLGGRSRRGAGTAERARSAVTQRIRTTIKKLGADHPELGRHLEASVRTGTYCSYRPERPVRWETLTT